MPISDKTQSSIMYFLYVEVEFWQGLVITQLLIYL